MTTIFKVFLFITAIVLIFFSVKSVLDYPVSDSKIQKIYNDVVREMSLIENAQLLYKLKNGHFTNNLEVLNDFVDKDSIQLHKDSATVKVSSILFTDNIERTIGMISTPYSLTKLQSKVDTISRVIDSIYSKDTKLTVWATKKDLLKGFSKEIRDREKINSHNNGIHDDSIFMIVKGRYHEKEIESNWSALYKNNN